MFINHASKEVTAKVVYYGPGLSGKTTNLQYIFSVTNPKTRGELVSIETDIERTLFFDLLPLNVGLIKGYQTKFQLYTVPGQIFYDSTRKLVLKGADGIVFVCDSQEPMEDANIESYQNLKDNLNEHNQSLQSLPMVFQYNKRDLKNLIPVERLNETLNSLRCAFFEASALRGGGVIETLREISSLIMLRIKKSIEQSWQVNRDEVTIQFDTDKRQEIIKKEDLPLKKITAENIPNANRIDLELDSQEPIKSVPPPPRKPKLEKAAKLDILDELEDKSRITVLKNLRLNGADLSVDIKDGGGNLLESLNLEVKPDVKKVTIILDVKK